MFKLPSPSAPLPTIAAFDLQLVNLTPETFVDHVMESFALGSAVRAAFFALPSEPLAQTRLAKVLTTANGEVRFTNDFGTDLTVIAISYFTNKLVIVSSISGLFTWSLRHLGNPRSRGLGTRLKLFYSSPLRMRISVYIAVNIIIVHAADSYKTETKVKS